MISPPPTCPRPAQCLWLLWNAAVLLLLLSAALTLYPGLHHDSALYATPIVNLAARGVWEIESFVPSLISTSGEQFTRHGQLYQYLLGRIFHCTSYQRLLIACSLLNAITFLATLLVSHRVLRTRPPLTRLLLSSGIAAMAALYTLWVQGRPEHLVPLLMLAPFAAQEWQRTRPHARLIGYAALGLVVVTSPLTGVLCCLGVIGWIGLRHGHRLVREVATCAAVSLLTALTVLAIACPVPPWQWVRNTTQASTGTPSNLGAFFTHLTDNMPLWNLIILGSSALLLIALARRRLAWLALLLLAVFVSLLWKLQVYVLAGFVPAIMLALVSPHGRSALGLPRLLAAAPTWIVTLTSLTSLATLVKTALIAIVFSQQGVTFAKTAADVQALQATLAKDERIGFFWLARPSFVAFGHPGQGLLSIEPDVLQQKPDTYLLTYEQQHQCKVRYLLLPQHGYLIPPPPPPATLAGGTFTLINNGWIPHAPTLWGQRVSDSVPGYQFALYRRTD